MSANEMPLASADFAGKVLVARSSYNSKYVDQLELGFRQGLGLADDAYDKRVDVLRVPGALELPQALMLAADHESAFRASESQSQKYSVLVALGCVIRGETLHFEIVSRVAADSLSRITEALDVPVINGILACENESQAAARASKGAEFGRSASIMAQLHEKFRQPQSRGQ